jgi:hypothetical protein
VSDLAPVAKRRAALRRWWLALGVYFTLALVGFAQYQGPALRDAGPEDVSARRALSTLHALLGEGEPPHPAGSPENAHLRVRLIGMLEDLGLEIWALPLKDEDGGRAGMVNLIARVPGEPRSRPVVLASHYDSCPAGPGAGDAGQCVAAIVETLRALSQRPLKHELWVLLTDGEEAALQPGVQDQNFRGLRGARDILEREQLPWGPQVPVVINFDARGNRGAVLLYETHRDNLAAMRLAANHLAPPRVTTSLMVNVYESMPRATDYTVFKRAGWPGWNFAVIGGAEKYHMPDDDLAHLSPRSIGHFAQHALQLLQRLDTVTPEELATLEDSRPAVFFDLLGTYVIVVPRYWNWIVLAITAGLLAVAVGLRRPAHPLRAGVVGSLLGRLLLTVFLCGLVGGLLSFAMRVSGLLPLPFVPGGELISLLYVVVAAVGIYELSWRADWWSSRGEYFLALALGSWILGGMASLLVPGGAYLCLLPSAWLAIGLLVDWRELLPGWAQRRLVFLAVLLPAVLLAPTYVLLARALGPAAGALLSGACAAMLAPVMLAWPEPQAERS